MKEETLEHTCKDCGSDNTYKSKVNENFICRNCGNIEVEYEAG